MAIFVYKFLIDFRAKYVEIVQSSYVKSILVISWCSREVKERQMLAVEAVWRYVAGQTESEI